MLLSFRLTRPLERGGRKSTIYAALGVLPVRHPACRALNSLGIQYATIRSSRKGAFPSISPCPALSRDTYSSARHVPPDRQCAGARAARPFPCRAEIGRAHV